MSLSLGPLQLHGLASLLGQIWPRSGVASLYGGFAPGLDGGWLDLGRIVLELLGLDCGRLRP